MGYNKNYINKMINDPLPSLLEEERIYLNVPYTARSFAKHLHCGFDVERKLWFTGLLNSNLDTLVKLYGVNKATSENMLKQLQEKLKD